jgi:hypothetical protein
MKRLLMTGVRQPGSEEFQFTVYGPGETRFPPAEMQMTLGEFQQWIAHSGPPAKHPAKGARQLPLLRCVSREASTPKP